jgi:hypothetical protein
MQAGLLLLFKQQWLEDADAENEQAHSGFCLCDSLLAGSDAAAALHLNLHAAGAAWAQVRAHRQRAAQGPEAQQLAA